jgi:hypothetical protein
MLLVSALPDPIILPSTFNVDNIIKNTVILFAVKLYVSASYNRELFLLQFILLYISLELK